MKCADRKTIRVAAAAMEGCVASGVYGPGDLFHTANLVSEFADKEIRKTLPVFSWTVLGSQKVMSHTNQLIQPTSPLDESFNPDILFIPGLGGHNLTTIRQYVDKNAAQLEFISQSFSQGSQLVGICTGTTVLAELGLLDYKKATTSWWLAGEFAQAYPRVKLDSEQLLTVSGKVICAAAGAAYFDATLLIIEKYAGPWLARNVAKYFLLDGKRSQQSSYIIPNHLIASDPKIQKADWWIRQRLTESFKVGDVSDHLGMSERTFSRRLINATGLTPSKYVAAIRIEVAKNLIATTNMSFDRVASAAGYNNTNSFHRLFKSITGITMAEYRSKTLSSISTTAHHSSQLDMI